MKILDFGKIKSSGGYFHILKINLDRIRNKKAILELKSIQIVNKNTCFCINKQQVEK